MKKLFSSLGLSLLFLSFLTGQEACDCPKIFDTVVEKVDKNYIALKLAKEQTKKDYQAQVDLYKKRVQNTTSEDCVRVLQEFLRFFKDG